MTNKYKNVIVYICMLILFVNKKSISTVNMICHTKTVSSVSIKSTNHIKYKGGLYDFLRKMGNIEGHGSYNIVNSQGYLGLYQFDINTLHEIGFNVSAEYFLSNPSIQDSAMIRYMKNNAIDLRNVINHFSGKYYRGIFITKSGILAGAHLAGSNGVLAFFYPNRFKNRSLVDEYGTSVSDYMKMFAGYNLEGI